MRVTGPGRWSTVNILLSSPSALRAQGNLASKSLSHGWVLQTTNTSKEVSKWSPCSDSMTCPGTAPCQMCDPRCPLKTGRSYCRAAQMEPSGSSVSHPLVQMGLALFLQSLSRCWLLPPGPLQQVPGQGWPCRHHFWLALGCP